jgi:hypothetical protein
MKKDEDSVTYERPNTAAKWVKQLDDDEEMARIVALEEDEKIAKKLQADYEAGTAIDDFHRPRTARKPRTENDLNLNSSQLSDNEDESFVNPVT